MDFDYDDNDDYENDYDEYDIWEIRINNERINTFDNKYDAIDSMIEEIDILSNNQFLEQINDYSDFDDETEIINYLINLSAIDFYEYIETLFLKLDLPDVIRLINLDNDEPEFGEL